MAEGTNSSNPTSSIVSLTIDHPQQPSILENFIIIWLDANLHTRFYPTMNRLQQLVNLIVPFPDSDRCLDFITDIKNEKIFLIVSDSLGEQIIPLINNLYQIDSVYVYRDQRGKDDKWANKEKKIKGVFSRIEPIYDVLRRDIRECEDNLIPFSILSSTYHENESFNLSDQLFIYTQLMKEILLEMEYQPNSKPHFTDFCFNIYQNNHYQCKLIQEFRNNYQQSSSIWWYTRECFIYSILNKAFRIRDMEILTKMSFFIRDIHQEIQRLHSKLNKPNRFVVYRGQGILEEDFQNILNNSNGFLSFNNVLLTTTDKDLSLTYARCARDNHQLIGVRFHMEIDRTISVFTPLDKISYYSESEQEILFSTHTIFRIHNVQQIEDGLWQIELRLTINENEQLKHVKEFIRKKIEGKNSQERLDVLMTKLQMLSGSKSIDESESVEMEIECPDEEDVPHDEMTESIVADEINLVVNDIQDAQSMNPLQITSD